MCRNAFYVAVCRALKQLKLQPGSSQNWQLHARHLVARFRVVARLRARAGKQALADLVCSVFRGRNPKLPWTVSPRVCVLGLDHDRFDCLPAGLLPGEAGGCKDLAARAGKRLWKAR